MPLSGITRLARGTRGNLREQAESMESGGTDGPDMQGKPVILLTMVGARTGKLRKTPLMRVEHDGEYAIVASLAVLRRIRWLYNVKEETRGWNFKTAPESHE